MARKLKTCPFCGAPAQKPGRFGGTMCSGESECPGAQAWVSVELWERRDVNLPPEDPELLSALGWALKCVDVVITDPSARAHRDRLRRFLDGFCPVPGCVAGQVRRSTDQHNEHEWVDCRWPHHR